jgi:hypothetical protein
LPKTHWSKSVLQQLTSLAWLWQNVFDPEAQLRDISTSPASLPQHDAYAFGSA